MNIVDIKKMLETAKWNSRYDNFPLSKEEIAIESLLSIIEQAEKALNLAIKHIDGKAEIFSEREKVPVLYQLNECLKSIQGEG